MLAALNLSRENLPESRDLDAHFTQLKSDYDARWPLFSAAKWFAPLGDGACSNIGSGCVTRERAAINIGTSGALRVLWKQTDAVPVAPRGAWCYRADRSRLLIGGALSNGGDLIAWIRVTFKLGPLDDAEGLLAMMEPDAHGLTVLPFLSGERSTGWKDDARFVLAGATLDTTPSEVLRAGMEAVAYRFAAIHDVIARSVGAPGEIIASGAAANASRTWIQIIADALGRPVTWSGEREASSRGAALMVLEAMGLITDVETAAQVGDREPRTRFYPDEIRHARYQAARERQEKLYCAVLGAPSILLWSD
jgi:gluconokinase